MTDFEREMNRYKGLLIDKRPSWKKLPDQAIIDMTFLEVYCFFWWGINVLDLSRSSITLPKLPFFAKKYDLKGMVYLFHKEQNKSFHGLILPGLKKGFSRPEKKWEDGVDTVFGKVKFTFE